MWMIAGIAGGIQPWWHHVGAYHEDRRMYRTAEPVMRWCKANEEYLTNRTPVATVGLVWSQRNTDFFGRDDAGDRVDAPYTGFMHALVRARVPYLPLHVDDIESNNAKFLLRTLILPNVGVLSDAQSAVIRRFVQKGGSLVATGHTGLYNEWGDPRPDFALADLFACHWSSDVPRLRGANARSGAEGRGAFAPSASGHTYLRLILEVRRQETSRRLRGAAPDAARFRGNGHSAVRWNAVPAESGRGRQGAGDILPAFPTYPPETAWMRQPSSDIPGLVLDTATHAWPICRRTSIGATRESISPITPCCWPT